MALSLEVVYAIHDFTGENEDEISFRAGEPIIVLERDEEFTDGWWQGENAYGEVGLFPANYTDQGAPSTRPGMLRANSAASIPDPAATALRPELSQSSSLVNEASAIREGVASDFIFVNDDEPSEQDSVPSKTLSLQNAGQCGPEASSRPITFDEADLESVSLLSARNTLVSPSQTEPACDSPRWLSGPTVRLDQQYLPPPSAATVDSHDPKTPTMAQMMSLATRHGATLSPLTPVDPNFVAPASPSSFDDLHPTRWDVDQVCEWLSQNGLSSVTDNFRTHEISGDVLIELDLPSLKELDISAFGKRFTIMQSIKTLKEKYYPGMDKRESLKQDPFQTGSPGVVRRFLSAEEVNKKDPSQITSAPRDPALSENDMPYTMATGLGRTVSDSGSAQSSTPASAKAIPKLLPIGVSPRMRPISGDSYYSKNMSFMSNAPATGFHPHERKHPDDLQLEPIAFKDHARASISLSDVSKEHVVALRLDGPITQPMYQQQPSQPLRPDFSPIRPPLLRTQSVRKKRSIQVLDKLKAAGSKLRGSSTDSDPPNQRYTVRVQNVRHLSMSDLSYFEHEIVLPDYQGWLKKPSDGPLQIWQRRWFISKGGLLYYSKGPHEDEAKPLCILVGCRIQSDPGIHSGHFGFRIIRPDNVAFLFSTEDVEEARLWIREIMKATIARNAHDPVSTSCTVPTVSIAEAQSMQPRPPSQMFDMPSRARGLFNSHGGRFFQASNHSNDGLGSPTSSAQPLRKQISMPETRLSHDTSVQIRRIRDKSRRSTMSAQQASGSAPNERSGHLGQNATGLTRSASHNPATWSRDSEEGRSSGRTGRLSVQSKLSRTLEDTYGRSSHDYRQNPGLVIDERDEDDYERSHSSVGGLETEATSASAMHAAKIQSMTSLGRNDSVKSASSTTMPGSFHSRPEEDQAVRKQYLDWINRILAERNIYVRNIVEDLRDGIVLLNFLELIATAVQGKTWRIEEREAGVPELDVKLAFRVMEDIGVDITGLSIWNLLEGREDGIIAILRAIRQAFPRVFHEPHRSSRLEHLV